MKEGVNKHIQYTLHIYLLTLNSLHKLLPISEYPYFLLNVALEVGPEGEREGACELSTLQVGVSKLITISNTWGERPVSLSLSRQALASLSLYLILGSGDL